MTSIKSTESTFIAGVEYLPLVTAHRVLEPGKGLMVITMSGRRRYCYLVPTWVIGLMVAADRRGRSLGRLYNRLVKGRPNIKLDETMEVAP